MKVRTLYWSHLSDYEKCPQMYLWSYGWGDLDLGDGPGKRKPKPGDKSAHHAVMGIVIQAVLEDFYNKYLWKHQAGLTDMLVRLTKEKLTATLAKPKFVINWREAPQLEEMEDICVSGVLGYLKTMKHHKFLGPYAQSEVELFGYVDKYLPLGGRADFIIRRDDTGITMLDGKNSQTKMKYTDPDQLRWYALTFALSYGKMPDRLGFVWYRYPYEEGTEETGVDWVEFTRRDLKGLAERAQKVRKGQNKGKFDPIPKAKHCQWCDYESVCTARQEQRAINVAKRAKKAGLPIIDGSQGVIELGFGPIQTSPGEGKT
jgi:hypothetical protein